MIRSTSLLLSQLVIFRAIPRGINPKSRGPSDDFVEGNFRDEIGKFCSVGIGSTFFCGSKRPSSLLQKTGTNSALRSFCCDHQSPVCISLCPLANFCVSEGFSFLLIEYRIQRSNNEISFCADCSSSASHCLILRCLCAPAEPTGSKRMEVGVATVHVY
jgi:hypothetical protein